MRIKEKSISSELISIIWFETQLNKFLLKKGINSELNSVFFGQTIEMAIKALILG
jgi:hypothetical protein